MSICWKITGLSPTQKLVLVSLADQANDDGVCWPSTATMETRTCLSERAIRGALRALEELGLLKTHHRDGRSSWYTLTVTPAAAAAPPRQQLPPTPAAPAPTPAANAGEGGSSCPHNRKEPPKEPPLKPSAYRAEEEPLPQSVPAALWTLWCEYRRKTNKTIKPTTARPQIEFLEQAAADGHDIGEIVRSSIRNQYTGLFLPKASKQAGAQDRARANNDAFLESIGAPA